MQADGGTINCNVGAAAPWYGRRLKTGWQVEYTAPGVPWDDATAVYRSDGTDSYVYVSSSSRGE